MRDEISHESERTRTKVKALLPNLPNFLIIGSPRCGTTSLANYLREHPDAFMAPEKEVRFFTEHFDRGLDWYRSRFAGASAERAVGEASPRYMYDDIALRRISEVLPGVRLIVIVRNPIDRAYSHYWMRRARGREPRGFEAAVRDELVGNERALELGRGFPYLAPGCYAESISRVLTRFERDRLFVSLLEDFREDAVRSYQELCAFLEMDGGFVPQNLGSIVNGFAGVRSVSVRRASKSLPRRLRRIVGVLNGRRAEYPPMSPDIRAELAAFFAPHNRSLEIFLGRGLAAWCA